MFFKSFGPGFCVLGRPILDVIVTPPGDAPAWVTPGATFGINFVANEAWIDEVAIPEPYSSIASLEEIQLSEAGYDQRPIHEPDFSPFGIETLGAFLTNLQAMNWAVRAEFDLTALPADMGYVITGWNANFGWECYIDNAGNVYSTDFSGNYNVVGTVTAGQTNVVATSNNPEGWLTSVNGSEATLDDVNTDALAESQFFLGCMNPAQFVLNGILRKYEFFPLKNAGELQILSA